MKDIYLYGVTLNDLPLINTHIKISYKVFYTLWYIMFGLILLQPSYVEAQSAITIQQCVKDSSAVTDFRKQMDIIDLLKQIDPFHRYEKQDTFLKAGKLYLAAFPSLGYTLESNGIAVISVNTSFYSSDPCNTNLSTITTTLEYSQKNQVVIPVISTVWFDKNKINLLGDYRYYIYPSATYGLGGQTTVNNVNEINYSTIQFSQQALVRLTQNLYGGPGYILSYHYNIADEGNANNFIAYNGTAVRTTSSGLLLHIKYDTRHNINNPKQAIFADITYRDNLAALGSNNNWQSVAVEYRQYFRLNKHTQNVLAIWSWNTFTFGHAPYFDLPATGWDTYNNSGRGYIRSRYRGADMLYQEAEYRFGITHNGLLGGVIFVNAESISGISTISDGALSYIDPNKFTNIAPGYGIGLRIKFNKHSATNICIDYGFGNEGSHGFFFNLGEVF